MKNIRDKLYAAWSCTVLGLKKIAGILIVANVIAMLIVSSFLVALRLDLRPRTDDAYLLAHYANIAPQVSGVIFHKSAQMPFLAISILPFHYQNLLTPLKKLLLIRHRFFHLWSSSGYYSILVNGIACYKLLGSNPMLPMSIYRSSSEIDF